MAELSSEEERALRELVDVRSDHESVRKFIEHRLYHELSRSDGADGEGGHHRSYFDGYDEQSQAYKSLVAKGMLEASCPSPGIYWYGDLTPEGRCYFSDKEAAEKRREKEIKDQRRHDYRVACFSFLGGALAGGLVTLFLRICLGL